MSRVPLLLRRESPLLAALLAGAALRCVHLAEQILADDEWHALVKSAESSLGNVLASFGGSDHSIPVTAYYELVANTIGLGEASLRAPFLLAGMTLIAVVALALRPFAGKKASDLTAWILALSPLCVFFSRFARPYMPTCLTTFVALHALHAFWLRGRKRDALRYVACAVLGGWLLLASLPAVLAPLLVLAALRSSGRERRALGPAVALGAAVLGAELLLFLPALLRDFGSLRDRFGQGELDLRLQFQALRILLGLESGWLVPVVLAVAALGLARQLRAAREWTAIGATAVAAQWLVTSCVLPPRADIFARYVLDVLPFLLGWLACGLEALFARVTAARFGPALAPGVLLALCAAGPFPKLWRTPDNWFASRLLIELGSSQEQHQRFVRKIPGFYAELARLAPASVTLIEAPVPLSFVSNPMPAYQGLHRQCMRVGLTRARDWNPPYEQLPYGYPFRSDQVIYLEDVRRGAGQGDYLVLHKDLRAESFARETLGPWLARMEERLGPPVFVDELVAVFDLRAEGERGR